MTRKEGDVVQGELGQIHSLEKELLPTDGAREVSKKIYAQSKSSANQSSPSS